MQFITQLLAVFIAVFLLSCLQAQQEEDESGILSFDPLSHSNFVNYWGQNSASASGKGRSVWQKPLSYYCQDGTENILVLAFLYQFGGNNEPLIDLSNASDNCTLFDGTQLLNCQHMESDIRYCQSHGRKILLSLGGATGTYGLSSEDQGKKLAEDLWDMFGGGTSKTRPFGNVSVDGFDLDIEAGSAKGYSAFIERIRELYTSDKSKEYYISGAPQCPFPDEYMSDALDNAWFDFVWVQFYNNYCELTSRQFNYDVWDDWARTQSVNKNVRLFLGVPGSKTAAGRGYVSYDKITQTISEVRSKYSSFGGVMMWDASAAYANTEDGDPNYAVAVARFLHSLDEPTLPGKNGTTSATTTSTRSQQTPTATSTNFISTRTRQPTTQATASATTTATSSEISIRAPTPAVINGALCSNVDWACAGNKFAQCVYGRWVVRPCPDGLVCHEIGGPSVYCGYPDAAQD